jgi:hypothetical protein
MLETNTSYIGDSLEWSSSYSDYPSSTWTLAVYFNGPRSLVVSGTADGSIGFSTFVSASQTAGLLAGQYKVVEVVTSGSRRATVSTTTFEFLSNPALTPAGTDARSHVRKVFEAIKAVIEGRATQAEENISIGGRSLSRTPLAELLKLYKQYEQMVRDEEASEKIAKGMSSGNSVYVRWRNG